ncbi:MAG TPA: hypothetical protein V6C72_13445 [Chroococcales cyanobacterium]
MVKEEKRKTAETAAKTASSTDKPGTWVERRRASLPQPDFTHYKSAEAYPGREYLFVGHSYNPEFDHTESEEKQKRVATLSQLFTEGPQWISAKAALEDANFQHILSRFEKDLLTRLPETALVGPAIDEHGKRLNESFTIWRKEMRKVNKTT